MDGFGKIRKIFIINFNFMITDENTIYSWLLRLGICEPNSVELYYSRVRDRDDICVMKCQKSEVIFLTKSQHIDSLYYQNKPDLSYWSATSRKEAILKTFEDDPRRATQFGWAIENKKWLDFGTGAGGILDLLNEKAAETFAVEPQIKIATELINLGYQVWENIDQAPNEYLDVITLFHVFEHLVEPIETMGIVKSKLKPNGIVIVEVPHAKDFLIDILDLDSFKRFTFWSEHLILHTRQSLETFLQASGFDRVDIQGFQRYPLANHLYWLSRGKPGGHKVWEYLRSEELDKAYGEMLNSLHRTDTLIAIARKSNL
ncbi:class I SAM-dependent methyltransferase [Microcoleus sp. Pol14C6]|uniref:class I SAM-dependent methyltransferase n=1 Tax=unclassified Microcoleus TaxID=2642155 RepID=UPI002FCED25F